MKKLLLPIVLLLLVFTAQAQSQAFKPFKVGVNIGYTSPAEGGGGGALSLEPAYRITDQIAAGIRLESAAYGRVVGEDETAVAFSGSYTLFGTYYLSDNNFRPFVGAGLGLYNVAGATVNTGGAGSVEVGAGTEFGFYPRIGFDLGHFNMMFDYNIIGATTSEDIDFGSGSSQVDEIKNSYLTIKLGFFFGGGRN